MRLGTIAKDVVSPWRWRPVQSARLTQPFPFTSGVRGFASTRYRFQSDIPPKVELRPYQKASIDAVLEYIARGERRLGLSLATGSGKTVRMTLLRL